MVECSNDGTKVVLKHAGDLVYSPMAHCNQVCGYILIRCPDEISCFLSVVRFSYEISCQFHAFLALDCECNRSSFCTTVFLEARAFEGDLSLWNVANVTNMEQSKSISIVENDLTWRELIVWVRVSGVM
jgi:surface protein